MRRVDHRLRAGLGLIGLSGVIALSIVPTMLPPHSLLLKLVGVLIAAAGALGYAVAVGGTSVWRVAVGWCIAMVLWATTLYGVHDVALTVLGRQDVCIVAEVRPVRGKSGTVSYVVKADCPGAGRQQTRGVYTEPAVGDPIELVRMDNGLVEPLQPHRIVLGQSLALLAVAGIAALGWTVVGAVGRASGPRSYAQPPRFRPGR